MSIISKSSSRSYSKTQNATSSSRIKFGSVSLKELSNENSEENFGSKKHSSTESSLSPKVISENEADLLDPTKCFHPQCSFAYSITGDVRRPSLMTECLPYPTYRRLAALWSLDPYKVPPALGNVCRMQNKEEEDKMVEEYIKNVERDLGIQSELSEDLQVEPGSARSVREGKSKKEVRDNPYLKFLKKSGALEVEQKYKANLGKKAGRITKMIIKNFLDWYESLGGNEGDTIIEESTLLELFQIGYDIPAAKALVVKIREMPTVPECLALLRNEPKHATRYGLRQFLKEDIRMENIPTRMFGFGRMLPKEKPTLRYKPPRNFVKKTWMECSRVPTDLDTMKTVWNGLEKLRSTIAFSNWLKNHPEIKPPAYLEENGLLEINYERWNQMYKGFEMQADVVEPISSDTKIFHEKISLQESKISESFGSKLESYDSL